MKYTEIVELERKHKTKKKEISTMKRSKSGTNCVGGKNGKMLFDSNDIIKANIKEEPKLSIVYLCTCYSYISLHNNRETYVQSVSTSLELNLM